MSSSSGSSLNIPDDCSKQWEILLLLISAEEKKIDRTGENEIDTMSYFCKNEGVRKIMAQWLDQMLTCYANKITEEDTAHKSDDISLLWRQRGNVQFRINSVDESYKCYSQSVLYATQDGPMYPLALANRSAALLRLKRFEECLADVDLALAHGYPLELRHKLLLRRADCYIELKQRAKAMEEMEAANGNASSLTLTAAHASEFDRHIKMLEKKLQSLLPKEGTVTPPPPLVLPQCYMGDNLKFTAASKAVELRRNEAAGRHVVTSQATRRGDVLFSEEPYAWVTLPAGSAICENCCAADINPVPCSVCSRSVYCGEECRSHAADVFHRWECTAAQAHLLPTIGIAHLALRVLLISAHHGFPPSASASPPTTAVDLFKSYVREDNVSIYHKDVHPFYRMFNLVTNFDKMSNSDYVQYALTATMLMVYLERCTSFFDDLPSKVPYPLPAAQLKLFAAALLLRGLGQLVCNGHAALTLATVEETGKKDARTVSEREVRRATAIYPSAAMMNHSCDPNIINTFYKSRLIVRCSRELSTGAEVVNCYGPHKAREPTAHRKAQLRAQYLFNCNCTACSDVLRKDFVLVFSAHLCQGCKGPVVWSGRRAQCAQCHSTLQLDKAVATIDKADELLAEAERAPTLEQKCAKVQASYRLRQQVLHRHHTALRKAADSLARLYADLGEYTKSVELIKQNIQSLEYQFGSFSVEVAHELRKLTDVMLERILNNPHSHDYGDWCLETHKIIKKSIQLTELNYGPWEPIVKNLQTQEAFVASLIADRTQEASDYIHNHLHYNLKI